MAQPIKDKVLEIIATRAMVSVDAIHAETTPEQLGLDSLGLVESVFAIEDAFDIHVPFNANETTKAGGENGFDISTIGAMIAAVEGLVAATRS